MNQYIVSKTQIEGTKAVSITTHANMMDYYNGLIQQQNNTISYLNSLILKLQPSKMELHNQTTQLKLELEEKDMIIQSQKEVIQVFSDLFYDSRISSFFLQLHLDHCIAIFHREQIDFDLLQKMTLEQFTRLGINETDYNTIQQALLKQKQLQ